MSANFNEQLRRAAGRQPQESVTTDQRDHIGQIGVGLGGAARPAPARSDSLLISDQIRRAALVVRGRVSAEDVWP